MHPYLQDERLELAENFSVHTELLQLLKVGCARAEKMFLRDRTPPCSALLGLLRYRCCTDKGIKA
jgi:hypothetical protein